MKTIRGHFDGNSLVLDEPAPVQHRTPVLIQFTELPVTEKAAERFGWNQTRLIQDGYTGSVADEVSRQRREE